MTLPHPALGFPLKKAQSGGIYPSEIKRRKEKKPMGASWRKDCISSHEPQDRRTGQQTSNTDSLPLVHADVTMTNHLSFSTCCWWNVHIPSTHCICFPNHIYLHTTLFLPCNKHFHIHSSCSYLYHTGLGGMPARCEECDGIIRSRGLSPPITQQSGLLLIFLWKHPGWKWSRKQQAAH